MAKQISVKIKQAGASLSHGTFGYSNSEYPIDRPIEAGGSGSGALGGEIWLMGLGGCYMSTLLAEIRENKADIDEVEIDVIGTYSKESVKFTGIQLLVIAKFEDQELFTKLINDSKMKCLVLNSLSKEINLTIDSRRRTLIQ